MKRELVIAGVCAIAGAVLALQFRPAPAPGPVKVQVDTVYAEHERPHLEHRSIGQKLTTAIVKPDQVRIADAPNAPGRLAVATYCIPALSALQPAAADSARPRPAAVLPDFGGKKNGPRLSLYSTLNDGRRYAADFHVRGRLTFQSSGDSVLVTGDRIWTRVVRGTPKCAASGAAGGAIGLLSGQSERQAAITALVTAAACAF